jgi:hypothetical protein
LGEGKGISSVVQLPLCESANHPVLPKREPLV